MVNNKTTIMVLRPYKKGDPLEFVFLWGQDAISILKNRDYNVIDMVGEDVTYDKVSNAISTYRPRVILTFSHGCPSSIMGQNACAITRRFDIDELMTMSNFSQIMQPLKYQSGCVNSCKALPDPCSNMCLKDTNVNLLKDTIVVAVACFTGSQLAKCAIKYGATAYLGYQNLLLFPVDDIRSENIFKEVHLEFITALADGKTVGEAEKIMNDYETSMIKLYKNTQWISLPLLWNKTAPDTDGNLVQNRVVLGDKNARI